MALVISADATLTVRAPLTTPIEHIENFVREKSGWIIKNVERARSRPVARPRQFVEGETFLYLGQSYGLRLASSGRGVGFDGVFWLPYQTTRPREAFVRWYKMQAAKVIGARVAAYAQRAGLSYKSIKITSAQRRWGSCSATGRLNFSWRLVMAPLSVIDSVIVHELAHLKHRNHSARFKAEVLAMMPDYKQRSAWLKENAGVLTV